MPPQTIEHRRLAEHRAREADWKQWGPYLSERAWGTVREDYSPAGEAWRYFSHDQARSRAYRWSEDGLLGWCDREQQLCLALALWNERDPILKERMFGLTGPEGNHGEDLKEYFFYLDSTPTHSYARALYKYPQAAFPYARLIEENRRRGRTEPEFELVDTGVFAEGRYFDVVVEYAKAAPADMLICYTVTNRGPVAAPVHVLPHLWFRNTWSWSSDVPKPELLETAPGVVVARTARLGEYQLCCDGQPALWFTENESNRQRLWRVPNPTPYVKDSINDTLIARAPNRLNSAQRGTKVAAHYAYTLAPGQSVSLRLRLTNVPFPAEAAFTDFDTVLAERRAEADAFYATVTPADVSEDEARVMRQAFAGLLWTKQYYGYDVQHWLRGDKGHPPPPADRHAGRNSDWEHLYTSDVISMPDKWEYPWFAAWDLAFHCLPLALIDPDFAKRQIILLLREWYMHPNGQIPAYEWNFGDVNPPVHAWATWRVYQIDRKLNGKADVRFLARAFHKLLLNFTWWVNRKDAAGRNIFQGGFLGLDNIGVFDRSAPLPTGGYLEQADGTAWMGMYCLNLLAIALELARHDPAYEDVATKFFEHFINIAHALNNLGGARHSIWDDDDGFYYDVLRLPGGESLRLKVRSMVGLIPLFAVETLEPDLLEKLPNFRRRMQWFIDNRPALMESVASLVEPGVNGRRLLSLVDRFRLAYVLPRMFDGSQFLSDYGVRALAKSHEWEPYRLQLENATLTVNYEPAESSTGLFGGNSNWRGPIWFPVNYLMVEALQKYHHYYGDSFTVEFPRYADQWITLDAAARELSRRLSRIFLRGPDGRRPVYGNDALFQHDPHWRDYILFYEYFHGDNGTGLGASHQTGWTALVAKLIQQSGGE